MALRRTTTIGFMTDWLDPGYQQVIMRGVLKAADERDYTVICYVTSSQVGTPLDVTPTHKLITPRCVDAMVVAAPSLGWGSEADRNRIMAPMQPLPMCFIALHVSETSGVALDNRTGMTSLVRHLVCDHGDRHFAFVRGPDFNPDSQERLDAFRQVLAEANLAMSDKHLLPGDFGVPSGAKAVEILLGERNIDIGGIDAIVAANDGMAMGVLEGLEARGIRVPHQVHVTGFDDCDNSRHLRVPLTTVRQPMFDQGKAAVRALTELLRSGEKQHLVLPSELVVRRSCGCVSGIDRSARTSAVLTTSIGGFDSALIGRRQALMADLLRVGRGTLGMLGGGWEMKLVSSLVEQVKGRNPDAFHSVFDEMLQRIVAAGAEPAVFHEIVSVLWRAVAPCSGADVELRATLESILDQARLATAAAVQLAQGANFIQNRSASMAFVQACVRLGETRSLEHLGRLLYDCDAALGLSHLDLALYSGSVQSDDAVRVFTYAERQARLKSVPIRASELPRLVQSERPECSGFLVTVLELNAEVLGIAVMNLDAGSPMAFDPLRAALSAAVKTTLLHDELRQLSAAG